MRKILYTIALALVPAIAAHAQTKITALPSGTPAPTDIVPFVAGPGGGTPTTKKATVADLLGAQHTTCASNQFANAVSIAGVLQCAQPSFSNLSGSITTGQQPSTTVNSVSNDTNIQGSIASQTLTFSWAGTLGVTRGGTGTGTAFTAGSVLFAGASGVYSQDNSNFFYDATNHRLGVGGTPTELFSLNALNVYMSLNNNNTEKWLIGNEGSNSDRFILYNVPGGGYRMVVLASGDTGIGTTAPGARLHVKGGDINIETQGNGLILKATDGANCFRVTVNNAGTLSTASVTCP